MSGHLYRLYTDWTIDIKKGVGVKTNPRILGVQTQVYSGT